MKKGLKELEKRILDKAYEEAKQIVSKSKKAKERIIKTAKEEAKKIEDDADRKGKQLLEIEKKRISSEKIIDEKKEYLILRQRIFERLIKDLEKKLIEMLKNDEFKDWIESKCDEILNIKEEKMVLITREEDKNIYRQIIKGLKNLNLLIEPIEPGFLLQGEKREYDFQFNLIAEYVVNKNRKLIISLIGDGNG